MKEILPHEQLMYAMPKSTKSRRWCIKGCGKSCFGLKNIGKLVTKDGIVAKWYCPKCRGINTDERPGNKEARYI